MLIATVTVAARLAGFARVLVFARIVGPSCLGDTYFTANTVPNIIFDIVAGGALTSLVVPVLAGPAAAGERGVVDRTTSALLTWAGTILIPMMVLGIMFSRQLISLLVGHGHVGCSASSQVDVGANMLEVFMPQVLLYGIAVILIGVLQAQHRFLGPALGPLISSIVVIGAYLVFGAVAAHEETNLSNLTLGHELILSVGTTLGVLALVLTLLPPAARTGMRLRPTYRFPPGVGTTIRAMAIAGAVVVSSQDIATGVALRLSNSRGTDGTVVLYSLAWTVFTVPWAIAAVPLATSAFPGLTAAWQRGDRSAYTGTTARTVRVLMVVICAAAAVMGAAAGPVARIVILGAPGGRSAHRAGPRAGGLRSRSDRLLAGGAAVPSALCAGERADSGDRSGGGLGGRDRGRCRPCARDAGELDGRRDRPRHLDRRDSERDLVARRRPPLGRADRPHRIRAGAPRPASPAGWSAGACGTLVARAAPITGVVGDLVVVAAVAAVVLILHTAIVAAIDLPTLRLLIDRRRLRRA